MAHQDKTRLKGGLLNWTEIYPWQRDNEFILTGYRKASFSYRASIRSIFSIHNETANIWSHLLGALLFLHLFTRFVALLQLPDPPRTSDKTAVGVYFLGVVVCFALSTIFHTFSDHSPHMHKFGNELDHLGIVLVMWGTGISNVYFSFYCQPELRGMYFVLVTGTVVGCGFFTLRPKFRQPSYQTARFLMYLLLGASLFMPIGHGIIQQGCAQLDEMTDLKSFFGLGLINFSGSAIYASRIPERWFPRTFDLLGHSHNWMHVLVLVGALVRLDGLLTVVQHWQEVGNAEDYCLIFLG